MYRLSVLAIERRTLMAIGRFHINESLHRVNTSHTNLALTGHSGVARPAAPGRHDGGREHPGSG